MDPIFLIILVPMAIGFAHSFFRKKKPGRTSQSGWLGLLLIASLLIGATFSDNQTLVWFFGLLLLIILPTLFFLALGSALGRYCRHDHSRF